MAEREGLGMTEKEALVVVQQGGAFHEERSAFVEYTRPRFA
ncbi:hypothetical protein [Phyllobacterium endophyticum]|nr:hypothetical protein [Phyllobacterium endophyticum]